MEPSAGLESTTLVERKFTTPGVDPLDQVEWSRRDVWVGTKHEHLGVEAPALWSDNAVAITSKLYLAKADGYREDSVKDLIRRIAAKITLEAHDHGYFGQIVTSFFDDHLPASPVSMWTYVESLSEDSPERAFYDELCYVLVNQLAVFNSPVLFNVGRPDRPQQVSACFILSVDDTTTSIMETARREAFIFKGGSGSGFSVSRLRGSMEPLSTGGTASGPVSFMRLWDAGAGTFKSGGTTRRAAKLVECDADHPDIRDFITCKAREEERVRALVDAGFNVSFSDDEGERNFAECTSFQNANNSVGVTDEFMKRAQAGTEISNWPLLARKTGKVVKWDSAAQLLDLISSSAHACACPGMMFLDRMNEMHTTPVLDGVESPIRSSNPCGEYLSNDDTSCNLASLNVLKFVRDDGTFDVESFRHVVDVMTVAMDALVTLADFPDEVIAERTRKLRQLGLGYSNMGAAIMAQGFPYDSDVGRDFAASVTALLTGRVYRKSAQMAELLGPFYYFDENRDAMMGVIRRHRESLEPHRASSDSIWKAACLDWDDANTGGWSHGFRNAQASVVPPAGTTSYFLDCDSTGIEPVFEHSIHKELAGGGTMTILNGALERAAAALGGYGQENLDQIARGDYSCVSEEDQAVFHTANEISYQGHLRMMGAVQPFVSGGISKTINMPAGVTVESVRDAYELAWQLGLKDVAIYRNGSKARQPHAKKQAEPEVVDASDVSWTKVAGEPQAGERGGPISPPARDKLPRTRRSITHKIHLRGQMGDYEGYAHFGMYEDGRLGEMFVDGFGRAGSFTMSALGAWAQDFSIGVQHGVDWRVYARKLLGVSDETGGMVVPGPDAPSPLPIRSAKSIFDYIVRYMAYEFGDDDDRQEFGVADRRRGEAALTDQAAEPSDETATIKHMESRPASNGQVYGPACPTCGTMMKPTGGCFTCPACFTNTGCG